MDSKNDADNEEVMEQPEFAKPEMQEARAFLRERFLQFIKGSIGKEKLCINIYIFKLIVY